MIAACLPVPLASAVAEAPVVRLTDVVDLNPRAFTVPPNDDDMVSFVPMRTVREETGTFVADITRPWREVKKGYTAFQDGDVIMAKITPCMENGKFAVARDLHGGRAAGSTEFHVLRPKPGLLPAYLLWFLFTPAVRERAQRSMRGAAGQLRVPPEFLRDLALPLPDASTQANIVAEIETHLSRLDAAVAALQRAQANLKRYRASVLKAACEGRLVPTEAELARREGRDYETGAQLLERILVERRKAWTGKGKYKEPEPPDTTGLPELPEGWCWASVGQVGEVTGGLTKNPKREKVVTRLPYLRVANVYANELRLDEIDDIGVESTELAKLLLAKGDLLVVEGNGSADQIGRVALWDGSIDPCVHQNHLIRVRPATGAVSPWLLYWLLSPLGRRTIEAVSSSTSGLFTLSVGKVSRLVVALPPAAECPRIAVEVDRLLSAEDQLAVTIGQDLARAVRLRQAVLQRSFGGLS